MVCLPKSGLNDFVRKTESKDENKQMKDKKLLFDRKSHVLYSKPCKKEILAKIALHYPEAERETVWEKVQRQYPHMEKRGSRYLRYALFNATKYVCHWDTNFAAYLAKKRAQGKHYNVAISHAAKKLVRLIFAMEKSGTPYHLTV